MVLTGNTLCEKNSLISSERLSEVWSLLQVLRNLKNCEQGILFIQDGG